MARQKNILPDELKAQLNRCKTQESVWKRWVSERANRQYGDVYDGKRAGI